MTEQTKELYTRLRDLLNTQGVGYGPTQSGNEFPLLERFFTPEDAQHVLEMEANTMFTAKDYAKRTTRSEAEASKILDDLTFRGLIFRRRRENEENHYTIVPVAHGILEFNVENIKKDFELGNIDYLKKSLMHSGESWGKQIFNADIPIYRAVPVNKDLVPKNELLPYDDAEELIRSHTFFAVGDCYCRVNAAITGQGDDPRKSVCLAFDDMAKFYLDIGIGKEISMQDAIDLIKESVEMGLCIQVANSKDSEIMCSCNPKSCGLLLVSKVFGGTATSHISNYRLEIDQLKCIGCGKCATICPAMVCSVSENKAIVDESRCVGCGQCVIQCPLKARELKKKEKSLDLNDTLFDTYNAMQANRKSKGEL